MSETAYPLQWPTAWPRTKSYQIGASRFGTRGGSYYSGPKTTLTQVLNMLESELQRLGASAVTISTNLQCRLDGLPRAGQAQPVDKGVAVYFTLKKRRMVLACDRWNKIECNLQAIAKHIEAIRGQERWGVGSTEQAFAGYTTLADKKSWREIFGFVDVSVGELMLKERYRTLAMERHPDKGGSNEAMAELNAAYEDGMREVA